MPRITQIPENQTAKQVTEVFGGYNHNLKIADGEFYEMENVSGDYYPLFGERKRRGKVLALTSPGAMLGKSKLAYIDANRLYFGGEDITENLTAKGFEITAGRQLISMGAYIIIWPDRLYINTEDYSDCGSMDAEWQSSPTSTVAYKLCKEDGTEYQSAEASDTAPEEPAEGTLWLDTSGNTHYLKQWSGTEWLTIPTVYIKISSPGIGAKFERYDGVTLSGIAETSGDVDGDGDVDNADVILLERYLAGLEETISPAADINHDNTIDNLDLIQLQQELVNEPEIKKQARALNGEKIIYSKGSNWIVITGILDQAITQLTGTVTVARHAPDMDYLTECENRLWGCKYGIVNGKTVNEIYACALGDFKNWRQYMGVASDSYAASVGSDGEWTGAITHLGYPLFFKENVLHRVSVDAGGAHRITDKQCRGVQKGSDKSLAIVGQWLYYKSGDGVCRYDGTLPTLISSALGDVKYTNAGAGGLGDKYYISMADRKGKYHLFVFDTLRGLWHREDDTEVVSFARLGDELYFIDSKNRLMTVAGSEGELEGPVAWSATTGLLGYELIQQKYIGRIELRMMLPEGSEADMYIEYNSSGEFRHIGHMEGSGTRTFNLPILPMRCDHFRLRIEGRGEIRIYSLAKEIADGGEFLRR